MLKILLAAVNAKYIHTCPAIYSLKAYADEHLGEKVQISLAEYTINDRYQDVLAGILSRDVDVIGFSTYIWNVDRVHRLIRDIRLIKEDKIILWAGGPEATYYPESFLLGDGSDLCMLGEGEEVFTWLAEILSEELKGEEFQKEKPWKVVSQREENPKGGFRQEEPCKEDSRGKKKPDGKISPERFRDLKGIAFLKDGKVINNGLSSPVKLDEIPFLYHDLSLFDNRILYYEASRGCPFGCAYCLSGREKGIRYRSAKIVEEELQFFIDQKVKQVKFIDRTFNADPDFAMRIWNYIHIHDNGITNFHFEIEADRITTEELELLKKFRPGLIQMEIGVQSANRQTLAAVHRNPDLFKIKRMMDALGREQNINLHLDLIAGLPFENFDSFRKSFNTVYAMRPHQLQLGFLKLLKGTELYDRREEYGLVCSEAAPYEVLKTRWISYEELQILHRVSDRVEEYVNSQGFRRTLLLAESLFEDAFSMFLELADYYEKQDLDEKRPSVQMKYAVFGDFIKKKAAEYGREAPVRENFRQDRLKYILETIRFDYCLHVHASRRMTAEEEFDPELIGSTVSGGSSDFPGNSGKIRIHFDYRRVSPVNGEAVYEYEIV